ncbi:MAG: hypothetical protein OEX75_07145 [Gammaproteobacteria bacterium]|nr:hypothetical protein [Gammaproteobacteria bacterium]
MDCIFGIPGSHILPAVIVQQPVKQVMTVLLERFISRQDAELLIQRSGILIADMHFKTAIEARMRTGNMSGQAGERPHVANRNTCE